MEEENIEQVETQDSDAQKIIDEALGNETEEEDKIELPSDEDSETKFAGKYNSVDDLKKGIEGLKSPLPDYVIDGMSDEALERHYVELRKKFSGKKPEPTDRKHAPKEEDKEEEVDEEDEKKEEAKPDSTDKKAQATETWKDIKTEFESTGAVSNDMYDRLDDMGIPSDIVDQYVDNIHKNQVEFTEKIYAISGGKEQHEVVKAWAEDGGIPAAELTAIQHMPMDAMLGAVQGIQARYDLANGKQEPKRIVGNTKVSGTGYANATEYAKDVADKRYGKNRAYTEAVEAKMKSSGL